MGYIKTKNSGKSDVIKQLNGITNSNALADKILNYVKEHKDILGDDEYLNIENPKLPHGFSGIIMMEEKYSINIKKSTIVILAFILDLAFSKGIISLGLGLAGFSSQTLHKIEDEEKCLIADILIGKKRNASEFDYYNNECVQNDILCSYRDDGVCKRPAEVINEQIKRLMDLKIIKRRGGYYKQTF